MKKIFILFYVLLISCSTNQNKKDLTLDGDYYIIDLDREKEPSISLSSLFKNIRTIILESDKECMIGQISDFQCSDEYIFILDSRKAKSLFVFDIVGKFIKKIGGIGRGPGEYVEVNAFTLDTENHMIYLRVQRNIIYKYKFDGTFIHSFMIQEPKGNAGFIQFYKGRLYSTFLGWKTSEDDYLLLEIDPNNGKTLSRSLSIQYNKGWNEEFYHQFSKFFMSRANKPPKYNQMFMDYIVSIGKEITPYIELKSKNLTTERDIKSFRDDSGNPNSTNILMSSKLFNVNCFIENDDFICFRYGMFNSSFTVIFFKKTGDVKLTNFLINDMIFKNDQRGQLGQFVFSDSKGAYVIMDTQTNIFNDFQSALNQNEIVPDLDKLEQLKGLDEDANPVIFYYEFK